MIEFLLFVVGTLVSVFFALCLQPFMEIWIGGEAYLLSQSFIVILVLLTALAYNCSALLVFRSAMGEYNEDRFEMICSVILKLAITIIMTKFYGAVGVQLGTLIASLPILWGRSQLVIKKFFRESLYAYWGKIAKRMVSTLSIVSVAYYITPAFSLTWTGLLTKAAMGLLLGLLIIIVFYRKNDDYQALVRYLRKIVKSKWGVGKNGT